MVDSDTLRRYEMDYLEEVARVCNYYDNDLHPLTINWRERKFYFGDDVVVHPFVEDDGTPMAFVEDGRGERIVADLINYLDSMFGDCVD